MNASVYPDDPRAQRLLDQLNDRFFNYVNRLPAPLRDMAKKKDAIEGISSGEPFNGVLELNPVLPGTPWLFWEIFRGLEDGPFLDLAEAGMFYVLASIILDHMIDGQTNHLDGISLLQLAFYEYGLSKYRGCFHQNSAFWPHLERLEADHLKGLSMEVLTQNKPDILDADHFIVMAHGKVSPIIVTIAALSEAAGKMSVLRPIETSLKHIAVASQLLDDIGDWKADLETGHMTYYLRILESAREGDQTTTPSLAELQRLINAEWIDVVQLNVVQGWLDRSIRAAHDLCCPAWLEYINSYVQLLARHQLTTIARHLRRVLIAM